VTTVVGLVHLDVYCGNMGHLSEAAFRRRTEKYNGWEKGEKQKENDKQWST